MDQIRESLPSDVNFFMFIIFLFFAVMWLIAVFGIWIFLTEIFYLISSAFNSEGSFKGLWSL